MYGVLIVEDELFVRLGIQNSVDWNKLDMQVIGSAQDGQVAWDIFQQSKPEIVITDLKMPVLGGMELISRIRSTGASTKIVILTCVEEFESARKAVEMGVKDYMLKLTMSVEDMEAVLKKIKTELDNSNSSQDGIAHTQVGDDIIKERLLKGFIFYNIFTKKQFIENAKKCNLSLVQDRLILCIMEIDDFGTIKMQDLTRHKKAIIPSITDLVKNQMAGLNTGEVFYNDNGHYIIITNIHDVSDDFIYIKDICKRINESIKMYFGLSVTIAYSKIYDDFGKLPAMFQEASQTMGKKFYLGEAKVLNENADIEQPYFQKISDLLKELNIEKSVGISKSKEYANIEKTLSAAVLLPDQVIHLLCQILQLISCNIFTYFTIDLSETTAIYTHQLENCDTLDKCVPAIKAYCQNIEDSLSLKDEYNTNISKAVRYIQSNFTCNLTLKQIAIFVNMSPSYFSTAFKKETKYSFIEYLNMTRVERAKKLLLGTEYKSYEIADKVGFSDNTYFCKVFKKVTGVSPIEFREKCNDLTPEEATDEVL